MNKLLILFIILLLGLVFCHFLGGKCYTEGFANHLSTSVGLTKKTENFTSNNNNESEQDSDIYSDNKKSNKYDNYNHYDGSSDPTKMYSPNDTISTLMNAAEYKEGMSLGQGYTDYKEAFTGNESDESSQKGIPKSMIPSGQEDLYVLKSEVVPPLCPACPKCSSNSNSNNSSSSNNSNSSNNSTCAPCPPCGRCPEPAFECKKVPNYNSINNSYLPMPVLSDFSNFGM